MTQIVPAIAQIEFQMPLTGPIERFGEECALRLIEGGRSKVVVRFYDLDSSITRQTEKLRAITNAQEIAWDRCGKSRGLLRRFYSSRHKHLARRKVRLEKNACRMVLEKLSRALEGAEGVAVEPMSLASFRFVRNNERHELMERARSAIGLWFFIFPYGIGDLCTNTPGEALVSHTF